MRTIGLVGGMTPESTKEYYERIIARARERRQDPDPLRNPVIVVYSLDLAELAAHQRAGDTGRVVQLLVGAVERLRGAGAEVGALTANTPHAYLADVVRRTELPLVSIVDATRGAAAAIGARRVLLLGTSTTMAAPMYPESFAEAGIDVVVPDEEDRAFLDRVIYGELALGTVRPEVRRRTLEICGRAIDSDGAEAVILGCTELPLVLVDGDLPVPLLDTVRIHVEAILDRAMEEAE
jgi:aspartate racemase